MRRFTLRRTRDQSGVSGTGVVAQGVESDSGRVAMFWLTAPRSVALYESVLDLRTIHGHGGDSYIQWDDPPANGGGWDERGENDRGGRHG